MKINDLTSYLEALAPMSLQESYDNSGLLIGDAGAEINNALICLDLTMAVLEEAMCVVYGKNISH